MLSNRLQKKLRLAERWAKREETDCFRLYDRDIPELPFAIDWYAGHLHVAVYRRPEPLDGRWLRHVVEQAAQGLSVPPERVATKVRERKRGARQYERQAQRRERLVVHERGHRFLVNLWDYLDTGLFLDHRITRSLIAKAVAGKRVLNLFAYTGSFGVYAAAAGAAEVVQVDLSRTYLDWARDNLEANGVDVRAHRFVPEDTLRFLEQARARNERFDVIVVDPPTFSNSKRTPDIFDVREDHPRLLALGLDVLSPRGALYFSTNAKHFRLEPSALPSGVVLHDLSVRTCPPDFEGRHSHRAWRIAHGDVKK